MKVFATVSLLGLLVIILLATVALPAFATPAQDSIKVNLTIRSAIAAHDPGAVSYTDIAGGNGPAGGTALLSAATNSPSGFALQVSAGDEANASCQQTKDETATNSRFGLTAPPGAAGKQPLAAGSAINFDGARQQQVASSNTPASHSATVHFEAAGGCQSTLVATITSI